MHSGHQLIVQNPLITCKGVWYKINKRFIYWYLKLGLYMETRIFSGSVGYSLNLLGPKSKFNNIL